MIYNLTLQVENQLIDSWKTWMNSVLVPEVSPYTGAVSPALYRVVLTDEGDTQTFAFQIHFSGSEQLEAFIHVCAPKIDALLNREFGAGVMRFATLLEPQNLAG
ncbi:MAG: DUF4286 family protein [Flavobacteriaceae bacterium]